MAGEIMGGENRPKLVQNRQFHGHNFTCDFCFAIFFLYLKRIYTVLISLAVISNGIL